MKVCSASGLKRIQTLWNSPTGGGRFLEEKPTVAAPGCLLELAKILYSLEYALTHKKTKAKR